jgi:hypothetical protein
MVVLPAAYYLVKRRALLRAHSGDQVATAI